MLAEQPPSRAVGTRRAGGPLGPGAGRLPSPAYPLTWPRPPTGLWGRQPAQPCPQAPWLGGGAQRLSRPPTGLCPDHWHPKAGVCMAPRRGVTPRPVHSPRPAGLCGVPRAPFSSKWETRGTAAPGCQREPLGGRALSPARSPQGRGTALRGVRPMPAAGRRAQHRGVHGTQSRRGGGCPASRCGKQGAGGGGTGFSSLGVGWGGVGAGLSGPIGVTVGTSRGNSGTGGSRGCGQGPVDGTTCACCRDSA